MIIRNLDQRFFKQVAKSEPKDGFVYQGYIAEYARSTMVLFSKKTGTPLAALVLGTPDRGVLSVLTERPSPGEAPEPYFQGMLNMPDQGLDISVVNLNDKGMINFNILHTPHRVSEVDPGPSYGINKVNELHSNQGYTILADQRNGREMILSGKTKTSATGDEEKVTVGDSEKDEQNNGLYFYLSVVPANNCPELVQKFAEGTAWKCVNFLVRKARELPQYAHLGFTDSRIGESWRNQSMVVDEIESDEEEDADFDLFGGTTQPPREMLDGRPINTETGEFLDGLGNDMSNSYRDTERVQLRNKSSVAPVDVFQSQAGELKSGQEVEVRSGYTGQEYAYEHCSEPTVLCLSICPELVFFPLPDLKAEVEAEVNDWEENEGKRLLDALERVFKSEHCVIDLESEPDTVILQCGHQCINHTNTAGLPKPVKCPLCRGYATAMVRAFT